MGLALHEVKTIFRKKKNCSECLFLCSERKGSIEHGTCKICKILRKGMDFFRERYLLLLCRHFSVRQDLILLCATKILQKPIQEPLLAFQ